MSNIAFKKIQEWFMTVDLEMALLPFNDELFVRLVYSD